MSSSKTKYKSPVRNIIDACERPRYFANLFTERGSAETWAMWFTFLRVLFGLPMSDGELATFRQCTHRDTPSVDGYREAWLVCGRRGGKSFMLALIAVWLAIQLRWQKYLSSGGEYGTIMIVAADRRQARTIFRYAKNILDDILPLDVLDPRTKQRVTINFTDAGQTQDTITLTNRIQIEIHTTSLRTTRGYTIVAALLDEIAFWKNDNSANPDEEILEALRPGLLTIAESVLLAASSPYARRGVLYETHKELFGVDDAEVLVWQAPTWVMNPTISRDHRIIKRAYDRDPVKAEAEYGAEFRGDVSGFFPDDVIDRAINHSRPIELPPDNRFSYYGFADPSGGRHDSFTLAIGHWDDERNLIVVDVAREMRPPFDPEQAVSANCDILQEYGVHLIRGDSYSGAWNELAHAAHGIGYERSRLAKSEIYLNALPSFTRGRVELPDLGRLRNQMAQLERRVGRNQRDSVDHPPGGADDIINAVCGLIVRIMEDVDADVDFAGGSAIATSSMGSVDRTIAFGDDAIPMWER